MAIPLGILGGIYLNEYGGKSALARIVRFMSEVMTGVPSIVMGLFIYTFVVLRTQEKNGFAGALALACLMLPIVIRTTDQMLSLVPQRAPGRQLRARRAGGLARSAPWCCRARRPGSSAGRCSRWRAPRARRHRCSSRSGSSRTTRTGACSTASTPRCPLQIFQNAAIAVPGRPGPGVGRGAHPHPHRVRVHDPRPARDGLLRPPPGRLNPLDEHMRPKKTLRVPSRT